MHHVKSYVRPISRGYGLDDVAATSTGRISAARSGLRSASLW
jgi:hypothetical protein